MVLPSSESPSTEGFNRSSGLLSSFSFLCLVHNPHPFWLQRISSWFLSQILFVSPSPGCVLCFPHSSCSNACSAWCNAGLEGETHWVLLWGKKVFDSYREVSASLFSLCVLPGKKGLKLEVCRDPETTPTWRSKAVVCSLCFPILFSWLLYSRLPFPWILSGWALQPLTPWHCICLHICTDSLANQFFS